MSWLSDLGNFVSDIPILGNITDTIDKGAYDTGAGTFLGGKYGIPSLWGSSGINFGTSEDQFKDITHGAGIAAATYGIGSGLAGAGEAGSVGAGGAEAGFDLAATDQALTGASALGGESLASTSLTSGGALGAETGYDLAATDQALMTGTSAATPATATAAGGVPAGQTLMNVGGTTTGTGTGLLGGLKGVLPYALLAGTALNAAGNKQAADQTNQNNADYLAASTWTPEKTASLKNSVDSSVLGVYGKNAADDKKTIASNLASAGRGGGSSESARRSLDIATRNAEATGINTAMLNSGAYTPSGLLTGSGAYNNVSPTASTMTGASGTLGNLSNAALMAYLYGNMNNKTN